MGDAVNHVLLPSGAVLIFPPVACPDCRAMRALVVTTTRGTRCVDCAIPSETITGIAKAVTL